MKKKKDINFKILTWLCFILLFPNMISAHDYLVQSLESIIQRSEIIVEGQIVELRTEVNRHNTTVEVITITIHEIVHGQFEDKTIMLSLTRLPYEDPNRPLFPYFEKGENVILHLKKIDDNWIPLGHNQGKFSIIDSKIGQSNISADEFKISIKEVATGKTDSILVPKAARAGILDHGPGAGTPKLDGEFHLIDNPLRYGPTSGVITLRINPAGAVDENDNPLSFQEVRAAIERAVDTWNNVSQSHTTFEISSQPYNGGEVSGDGISSVTFVNAQVLGGSNGAADIIHSGGIINEVDLIFHSENRWNTNVSYPGSYSTYNHPVNGIIGPVDLEDVAAHEVGHGVGLHHVSDQTPYTMHPTNYQSQDWWENTSRRSLEVGDRAGKIYQIPDITSASSASNNITLLSSGAQDVFNFSDDFTIPSGFYFEIESGKTVQFNSGTGLIANGELHIDGTSVNPIILEPTGSSWAGVHLHGSGSSLSFAEIHDAVNGVSVFNTSDISLGNLEVSGSSSYGISLINSTGVSITNTVTEDNGLRGISIDGNNNSHWSGNLITEAQDGIRILGGASLNNLNSSNLTGNWNGVVVRDGSLLSGSSNNFYNNGGRHAVSIVNSTVNAQNNWWGQAPPNPGKFQVDGSSTLDYSNWSTSGPTQAPQMLAGTGPLADSQAAVEYSGLEKTNPETFQTVGDLRTALAESEAGFSGQLTVLENLTESLNPDLRPWADIIRMELHQLLNNHTEVVRTGSFILDDRSTTAEIRRTTARRMFYSHLLGLQEPERAAGLLPMLEKMDDSEEENGQLAWLLEYYGGQHNEAEMEIAGSSDNDKVIIGNYPNPFNPTTTLQFSLPSAMDITLRVYDILGRHVSTLVNNRMDAGTHQVAFDGSDLSSGHYLYLLETDTETITGKMVIMK